MIDGWESKRHNRHLFSYCFAPFYQEAASLLLAAHLLWHPWSVKRKDELKELAYKLKSRVNTLRRRGLSWACNSTQPEAQIGHILHGCAFKRHNFSKDAEPSPEAAELLVSTATQILLLLVPELKRLEKTFFEERGRVREIHEIIEDLMEFPLPTPRTEITQDMLRFIGARSLFLECEGLAYMQATLEDRFAIDNPEYRGQKKSGRSDEEIAKMASEIGVDFHTLKDVFETEHSPWWKISERYHESADEQKEGFVDIVPVDEEVKNKLRLAWSSGTKDNGSVGYLNISVLEQSKSIVTTIINALLNFDSDSTPQTETIPVITPALLLPETGP